MTTVTSVSQRWTTEDGLRGDILTRCEKYASWTIPHIFPMTDQKDTEQQNSVNGMGAESVNFLSNKLTTTLFSPHSPYFRILMEEKLLKMAKDANFAEADLETALAKAEKECVREQESAKGLRSSGSLVGKLLIITGNCLVYYNTKGKPIQAFSLRDYVLKRDGEGIVYKIITREKKDYVTLSKKVKEQLPDDYKKGKENSVSGKDEPVTLFTEIRRKLDKDGVMTERWEVQQAIDAHDLMATGNYPTKKLPWIPLVWHLNKGDNYGRGLVEDYAGDFHALTTLATALVHGLAILSDIKFLVKPGAVTDVEEFNNSPTGSYHQGKEGDITSPQFNKGTDFAIMNEAIDKYERRISRAFLNGSANRRQAERVTAEELRMDAQDLETSQGGLYSRMVVDWQVPYAILGLADIKFELGKDFDVQIVAGMDTLSRSGDMDNFRWMLDDLAATQNIPDDIRQGMDPIDLISFIAANRGVDQSKFTKSREVWEADRNAEAQQNQQNAMLQEQAKTEGNIAVEQAKK